VWQTCFLDGSQLPEGVALVWCVFKMAAVNRTYFMVALFSLRIRVVFLLNIRTHRCYIENVNALKTMVRDNRRAGPVTER